MTTIGHNSQAQLRSLVDRIERLNAEKADLSDDIKEIYAEAKGGGFDPKIIRKVIAMRKKWPADRHEEEELIRTYMQGLNMPIFDRDGAE